MYLKKLCLVNLGYICITRTIAATTRKTKIIRKEGRKKEGRKAGRKRERKEEEGTEGKEGRKKEGMDDGGEGKSMPDANEVTQAHLNYYNTNIINLKIQYGRPNVESLF